MTTTEVKGSIKIRYLQALTGEHSLTLVIPKTSALELRIGHGDFLECYLDGSRLIVDKANSQCQDVVL